MRIKPTVWSSLRRHFRWKSRYGQEFDTHNQAYLTKQLENLEEQGLLGNNLIDAGSGIANSIPFKRKKVLKVDIGNLRGSKREGEHILNVRGDIERLTPQTRAEKLVFVKAARFFGVDPRSKKPPVDSILLSNTLNYVDFRESIKELSRFLKKGGRLIISNTPGKGITELFSENGVKSNSELVEFLQQEGFEFEIGQWGGHELRKNPNPRDIPEYSFLYLVARKK